ncbi:hypothetical protein LXL04_038248 [Taraxacum kok-saghyz]
MSKISGNFFVFLLPIFILAISEIATAKLCEKTSQTFSGFCMNDKCDKKCIEWEKALHGACHARSLMHRICFCYFDCAKKPPNATPAPPGALPPPLTPPSDGGKAPPDGGSPPPADGGGGGGGGDGGGGGGR